ncbi:QsdR family transcriptional regulator [Amycolatopsis acididurans]|uniref:QsdR family transcriptional regulator n=1 Tax=Amycolatopsis acididurans TaxID=2724524 RepID=UPI0028ABD713|nr:QsdR family transcriptional regulator [Amycolatopsis acididurans]
MTADVSWEQLAAGAAIDSARRQPATRLSGELYGARPTGNAGPREALRAARRSFVAGERIDMGALAGTLGVDRATLFRWVGNRDELLSEVIWSLCLPTWQRAVRMAEGTGVARVMSVFRAFSGDIINAGFFRAYLRRERERALRLLTTRAGVHQSRVIALIEGLLRAEQQSSGLTLPLPVHDMAYVMTRVVESFIYADLIIGEEPDAAKAAAAVGALLGPASG